MNELIKKYKRPLAAIALVHLIGTRKYDAYSWQNYPTASNSTCLENIDALIRHFSAHSMGQIIDPDGLPHMFNMCCRAGMLVSTFYRKRNQHKTIYKNVAHPAIDWFGIFLTPEELLVCSKEDQHVNLADNLEQLYPHIWGLLVECAEHTEEQLSPSFTEFDIYKHCPMVDCIFHAIFKAFMIWDQTFEYTRFLQASKFRNNELTFLNYVFDIKLT